MYARLEYFIVFDNIYFYPRLRQQPATALDARSSNMSGYHHYRYFYHHHYCWLMCTDQCILCFDGSIVQRHAKFGSMASLVHVYLTFCKSGSQHYREAFPWGAAERECHGDQTRNEYYWSAWICIEGSIYLSEVIYNKIIMYI